jgi:hypothetical protein
MKIELFMLVLNAKSPYSKVIINTIRTYFYNKEAFNGDLKK